jgi:uncharacterized protein YbaA (DUF1428 family)
MSYADGFLLAIPKKKLALYRSIARRAGKVWMKHGALQYVETVGDDLTHGKVVSFTKRSAARPGEVPVFSWILYKSKADRNRINALVMKDPAMLKMMEQMKSKPQPFDMKRLAYGGFKTIVEM